MNADSYTSYISKEISREGLEILKHLGFRKKEEDFSQNFGDSFVTYFSRELGVSFIRERGKLFVQISALHPEHWWDLSLIMEVLGGSLPLQSENLIEEEKLQNFIRIIQNNMSSIIGLFRREKYEQTANQLRQIQMYKIENMIKKAQDESCP